jgi:L-fuconolactonase
MTPIIDAHQHIWDLSTGEYGWLEGTPQVLRRTYAQTDVLPLMRAHDVSHAVLVQADDTPGDTARMLEVAERHPDAIAGVVGWVDLTDRRAADTALDRLQARSCFCGVRHLIHDEPDPDWILQPAALEGLALLAERGVPFDVVAVLPRHLEHVATIARRLPDLRLIVDHLAKPPIADKGWEPWAGLLGAAAQHPNVYAKVSGLNTAAAGSADWSSADLQPYVDHALECFGPERLLFGSDWPVALLAGDYGKVIHETRAALSGLTPGERDRIFGGTAVEAYHLDVQVAA